jgi:cytochrome b subunit of formate dehydrogenase
MALDYSYISRYRTAKGVSVLVSAFGWVILIVSLLLLIGMVVGLSQIPQNQSFDAFTKSVIFVRILSAVGGIVTGLLLIAVGQGSKAALDSADYNGEMLAMMKANLAMKNTVRGA